MIRSAAREVFRLARLFFGLFLYALGIVLSLRANVGYAPWDVFQHGLTLHLGITMGQANILVGGVIVFITAFTKERIGVGTIFNMIFIGVFIDVLLSGNMIPLMQGLVPSAAMLTAGLFVIGFATVFYMGAGYGSGPRDTLMVLLTKWSGRPVGLCLACLQAMVLLTGWLLGGYAGIGTIVYMFGLSSAVQIVFTITRFDVKKIHQESCYETFLRVKGIA